jgi:hypothetical protein
VEQYELHLRKYKVSYISDKRTKMGSILVKKTVQIPIFRPFSCRKNISLTTAGPRAIAAPTPTPVKNRATIKVFHVLASPVPKDATIPMNVDARYTGRRP